MLTHGYARATVVGAGLMGRRLAALLSAGGLTVSMFDSNPDVLASAAAEVAVRASADLADAVADADLVIEAVFENLQLKQGLFAQLVELAPDATLATNTSVLSVTSVAAAASDGRRIIGTHWWNPPDLIPIVEVVGGELSDPSHLDRIELLLRDLGKTPVRVRRDGAGFVGNRLQHALWREAIALIAEGVADAATVDLVVRNTIGLRLAQMGPIENADFVGLDLTLAIHEAVLPVLDREPQPSPLLRELVDAGQLGAKSGAGFLEWPPGRREQAAQALAQHVRNQLRSQLVNVDNALEAS